MILQTASMLLLSEEFSPEYSAKFDKMKIQLLGYGPQCFFLVCDTCRFAGRHISAENAADTQC
jgi:hypothetical protein